MIARCSFSSVEAEYRGRIIYLQKVVMVDFSAHSLSRFCEPLGSSRGLPNEPRRRSRFWIRSGIAYCRKLRIKILAQPLGKLGPPRSSAYVVAALREIGGGVFAG